MLSTSDNKSALNLFFNQADATLMCRTSQANVTPSRFAIWPLSAALSFAQESKQRVQEEYNARSKNDEKHHRPNRNA